MDLLCPTSGITYVLSNLMLEQNKIPGIESHVLAFYKIGDTIYEGFEAILENEFDRYLDVLNPDLVIIHSFYYISYIKAAKCLRDRNIPYFLEPHGAFGKNAMKKSKLKKIIANATIFRSLIKKSSGIIYLIDAEKRDTNYNSNISAVIPNGININTVEVSASKPPLVTPEIYFLGRYDMHHKGLDYMFGALRILDSKGMDFVFKMYGRGSKDQEDYINNNIANLRHIKAYNCGAILGCEKKKALEQANILLLTSRYEGFPMAILDSFCYGNPCIVTPGTNVIEEVEKNGLGWATQLDEQTIANTIINAIQDYQVHYEEYYRKCKEYVLENYSWEKIAQLSIREYKRMLNNNVLK